MASRNDVELILQSNVGNWTATSDRKYSRFGSVAKYLGFLSKNFNDQSDAPKPFMVNGPDDFNEISPKNTEK